VEEQSWKTDYLCLNMPEPLRLGNMEAVDQHFRQHHKDNIIKSAESHTLNGAAARNLRSPDLTRLVRSVWEDQRRFPLQIATILSQQFASHGLQFFKVNKSITHVSVARPHYLDLDLVPVSEGVKRIVDYINANPKCTRRKLIEALAPSPAPAAPAAPTDDGQPAPQTESVGPTAEQNALIADLHWLIHQGHVIEFANGTLETAKKPLPKPPRPEPKVTPKPAETAEGAAASPASAQPTEAAVAGESTTTAVTPDLAEHTAIAEVTPPTEPSPSPELPKPEPETATPTAELAGTEPTPETVPTEATPAVEPHPVENPSAPVESRS
jgi:hypothetical protein